MGELHLDELVAAAACAAINERCAKAYLHDVRGSMQAVYSALELVGRSAKAGGDNAIRVEKACDLAKRAITNHERSMLDVMQHLMVQRVDAAPVNIADLLADVILFLRNDAAHKAIAVRFDKVPTAAILADRNQLYLVLVGLLTNAIDALPAGTELTVSLTQQAQSITVSIESAAADFAQVDLAQLPWDPGSTVRTGDLALLFARQFVRENGGDLESVATGTGGALRVIYPSNAVSV